MPRKKLIIDGRHPFHVTARSNNQDWFQLPLNECWSIFERCLLATAERYGVLLHAFVLMSNHFHLLLTAPSANLSSAMRYLMTESSRKIARGAGVTNHVYGSRYKWSWLPDEYAQAYVYKYVLRNPVKAGIVGRVEEYRFSTMQRLLTGRPTAIPLSSRPDWNFARRSEPEILQWLNAPTGKEENLIRAALRRSTFAFSRDAKVQRQLRELEQSYLPPMGEKSTGTFSLLSDVGGGIRTEKGDSPFL